MLHHLINSPEHMSLEDCLAGPKPGETCNYQYDDALFEEAIDTTNAPCSANNNNPATATETSPASQIAASLPYCDPCFAGNYSPYDASDILSVYLNPQPPTEPEPDILPPIPMLNQLNPMICSASFTSYSPESMAHQLPVDLSGCLGYEPSMMQPCPFLGANGGIGGEFYDGMGFFAGDGMAATPPETVDACGYGIYGPGSMRGVYSQGDLQVLGDNQHLMAGYSSGAAPLQVPSDISTLDESSYKIGPLTVEERKLKIGRFLMKRNHRNFGKKIKYECRKTLADSRPRVRGRFAKNEDCRDAARKSSPVNQEYDGVGVATNNEEEMLQPSEMLVQLSDVNSFKYNYSLGPWI